MIFFFASPAYRQAGLRRNSATFAVKKIFGQRFLADFR